MKHVKHVFRRKGLSKPLPRQGHRTNGVGLGGVVNLFLLCGTVVFSANLSLAQSPSAPPALLGKSDARVAHRLQNPQVKGWTTVIVQVAGGDIAPAQEAQVQRLGGYVYRHLNLINAAAVRIPNRNLAKLGALAWVEHVSQDEAVAKTDEFTVEHSGADIALSSYGLTGNGVNVAILDSGVRNSQDLADQGGTGGTRIKAAVNFVTGDNTTNDMLGHGTHVAGIVAGNGYASSGTGTFKTYYGIARRAGLVNVRVLDDQGNGLVSDVIKGIDWVVSNQKKYNIRVINISLGHAVNESYKTDPLCIAVAKAWKAGIVVVCSAGNEGRLQDIADPQLDNEGFGTAYGSIQVPGNSPYAITVGAAKSSGDRVSDRIATYSSRGPSRLDMVIKPDIVAPGNKVVSLLANNTTLDNEYSGTNQIPWQEYTTRIPAGSSSKYFRLSGTSMAAPVVSGAVALMLEKYPTLTPDTVKARLMLGADKWAFPDGTTDPLTFGAGYLNIPAALNSKVTVPTTAYAMSPTLTAGDDGLLFVNMDRAIWGGVSMWGTGLTDLRAIWGMNAIWGSNYVSDDRALWGKAYSVQGDRAIWGGTSMSSVDLSGHAIQGDN